MIRHYLHGDLANLFREPIVLMLTAVLIIHGIMPPLQHMLRFFRYELEYSVWSHVYSMLIVLLFVGIAVLFYGYKRKFSADCLLQLPSISPSGRTYLLLFVLLPASIAAPFFLIRVWTLGYRFFMQDRIFFSDRIGGFGLLMAPWIYIVFIVCAASYFSSQGRDLGMRRWAILLGLVVFGFFGFVGGRNSIFVGFSAAIGAFLVTTWRPRIALSRMVFSTYGLVVSVLLVLMVIMGFLRAHFSEQEYGRKPVEAVVVTLNSAFGNHENVNWLVDNEFQYQYGRTYLAAFVTFYPRAFWAGKPVGAGPVLKNMIVPGSYEVGQSGVSSLTTGLVTESYMNGGVLGVIIVGAVTGLVLRFLAHLRLKCLGPWSVAIYAYTAFTFGFSFVHNEFYGACTRWQIDMLPLFLGWFLFEFMNREEIVNWQSECIDQLCNEEAPACAE